MHCLIPGAETFWIACGAGDLAIDQSCSFRPADFAKSELYLFADYGDGSLSLTPSLSRDVNLGSAGIGARIGYTDDATFGLEYAEPWDLPVTGFSDDSVVTVSWAFKYQP